jgi:signal transduction histidine kinase
MKKASILIVEDDFIVASMLQNNLTGLGYTVVGMTSSGEEAITLAEQYRPSLVLLDIRLQGAMDGIETARHIHERFDIPVVYLTAHSDDQTFSRAIETTLYGYLIKPVTISALRTTIEVALEKFRVEEALRQANHKLNLLTTITRHDVLNTLTALMNTVDLAMLKTSDPSFRDHLSNEGKLLAQIQRQIEFTHDYETLGKGAPVWHDLQLLVENNARQVLPKTIAVETDLRGILLFADPLFEKVIYNLMDNAVRHGGTVTRIHFSVRDTEGGLCLTCADDGEGIPDHEKSRIFERGYGKNTGLGLFLVREILGITGFTIRETGVPGKGAQFEIVVPDGMYRTANA